MTRRKGYAPSPPEERFWAKVDRNGPVPDHRPGLGKCWVWTGALDKWGYGHFLLGPSRPMTGAHRASWELNRGAVPPELCVLHKCDRPRCVRPDHLFLGTHADNVADKVAKGRARSFTSRGEDCSYSKLTENSVREIRAKYVPGLRTLRMLACEYDVRPSHIHGIVSRKTWSHVQ